MTIGVFVTIAIVLYGIISLFAPNILDTLNMVHKDKED